jgi:hypothetical protein
VADKTVVFIMGSGHSGSTLLELVLGSHSRVFGLGELVNLYRGVDGPRDPFPRLCRICEERCPFWNDTVDIRVLQAHFSRAGHHAPIRQWVSRQRENVYQHFFGWSGKDVLIDSSKRVHWIAQQLQPRRNWKAIAPVLIYLTRDGRAVVNSKLRKYPETDIRVEAREWKERVERMNEFYADFPERQRLTIAYEQLASQPESIIRNLCDFLNLDFEPGMLRFWEHDHHTTFGNAGTRSLIARFRGQSAERRPATPANSVLANVRSRHGTHYDDVGLAIRLDLRWKWELTAEQLEAFETIAGETNRPFAYDEASPSTAR